MKIIVGSAIALALTLGVAPGFGGGKDPTVGLPQYNLKTETNFVGTIAKVREVPIGEAFAGIHVTMQSKSETIEVYLGPADFIKLMGMPLRPGVKDVTVIGSKVKFEGSDLVLARELRIDHTELLLRDEKGFPNWIWAAVGAIPTGF